MELILADGVSRVASCGPWTRGLATWLLLAAMYPFFYPAHAGEMAAPNDATASMLSIFFDGAAA